MGKLSQTFRHFAEATARYSGRPAAFLLAVAVIVVWAITGPMFKFNDTWQLVIITGTTIVTFLMVFLIQNSQNRDGAALQIKLDELIRATEAHNGLLDVEDMDDETLERIRENYRKLARERKQKAAQAEEPHRRAALADEAQEACAEMDEIDRELEEARDKRNAETAKGKHTGGASPGQPATNASAKT